MAQSIASYKAKNLITSNNECPAIAVGTPCGQSCQSIQKKTQKVNVKNISTSELTSLKKNDPFMYYSIPIVRHASLLLDDVSVSRVHSLMRRASCPSRLRTIKGKSSEQSVSRKSRISFECHIDLHMGDFYNQSEEEEEDDDLGES